MVQIGAENYVNSDGLYMSKEIQNEKSDTKKTRWGINSFWLHIIAMTIMLGDHMWATVIPGSMWLTNIGRMAFPIFAFMIVEGYFHTKSIKKYILRMLIGAVISEVPFNLMTGGYFLNPFQQNVMWSFLLSLLCIHAIESIKKKNKYLHIPMTVLIFGATAIIGMLLMVDYFAYGILAVAVFYIFRGKKLWQLLLQAAGLILIFGVLYEGMLIDVKIFGFTFEIKQEVIAVMALIPIWLYNGEQGPHNKFIQAGFYLFYPVHMLILSLLALYVF